jgi:type IX secretion system PorP/SprF family membrane protein
MKGTIKYLGVMLLLLIGGSSLAQQNIQMTQYIFNSLSVNPAYAGYKEEWFGQLGLRSQWTGWDGAPQTGVLSIDGVLDPRERRHGVGLQLDSYDEHRLALGIAGGVTQYGLDGNKLSAVDGGDVVLPDGKIATWRPDIRLGVYYSNPKWYAGVSVQDLFAGTESDEDFQFNQNSLESIYRNVHGYLIAGALFELEQGLLLRPSILIKDDFRGPTSLDVNAMFIFNDKFWIGGGYRTRARIFDRDYQEYSANKLSSINSLSGIAQFYVSSQFRIGYSYDHMLNRMAGLQGGTHEVTLGVTFGRSGRQVLSPRYF